MDFHNWKATIILRLVYNLIGQFNYMLDIWFDYSLGGLTFYFSSLSVETRIGIGRKNARGEFDYYDKATNQQFDFYKPF